VTAPPYKRRDGQKRDELIEHKSTLIGIRRNKLQITSGKEIPDTNNKMMEKQTINKRFIEAIDYILKNRKNINKSYIANVLDISNSKFSEILKGRMNAGIDSIAMLCDNFGISAEWILMGKGNIKKGDTCNCKELTVYRQSELISFNEEEMNLCKDKNVISAADFNLGDFAIRATTDSMTPYIAPNDIVIGKRVSVDSPFTQWGKAHIIATKQGIIFCDLQRGKDDNLLTVHYANERYAATEIPKSEISGMALVIGIIHPV